MNLNTIHQRLQSILAKYLQARKSELFAQHPLRAEFAGATKELQSAALVGNKPSLRAAWSMGKGNWAKVPWIALLDNRETDSTQHGVYCAYLFRQDMSGLYLTLTQGVTVSTQSTGRSQARDALRSRAQELRTLCADLGAKGFKTDGQIDLRDGVGRGRDYENATIAYKFYEAGTLPSDDALLSDMADVLTVYQQYVDNEEELRNRADRPLPATDIGSGPARPRAASSANSDLTELVREFARAADTAVLRVDQTHLIRLAAAAMSKRFVILTGLAGSGKTLLALALARWLTPATEGKDKANPHYAMVPVGADWTGNENVLGYPNGLDGASYVTRPALDLMLHASDSPGMPHILILDEMNLSHVERYFADILSAIESNEAISLHRDTDRKADGRPIPPSLAIPGNLFIIGTVNVDETTYMFSPKVLDRANVIEFRMYADDLHGFLSDPAKPDMSYLDGKGAAFGEEFVKAAMRPVRVPAGARADYEAEMMLLFNALHSHGAEFGYRVAHEAARFVHYYNALGGHPDSDASWLQGALDCVVVQKLLPKLHGSRAKLGPLLKTLWFLSTTNSDGRGADPLAAAEAAARATEKKSEPTWLIPADAPYPLSAEKIGRMWRLLNENGFASFAEA